MAEIHIREFQFPGDYPAVRKLWETAGSGVRLRRSDEPEEIRKKFQHDPELFLVAELDGSLAGSVIGGFDGRRGLIYHLAVRKDIREQGIGSLLMDEVERRLKGIGCIKSYLLVTAENEQAMRFYEKRGWEHMDSVRLYGKDL